MARFAHSPVGFLQREYQEMRLDKILFFDKVRIEKGFLNQVFCPAGHLLSHTSAMYNTKGAGLRGVGIDFRCPICHTIF
jgi:hypothetical protein